MDSSPTSSSASFASPVAAHGQTRARYPLSAQVSASASASPSTSPSRAFTLHADTALSRREAERRRPFADDAGDSKSVAATSQSSPICDSTGSLTSSPTKSDTQPSSTQGHVSTSQSSPSCILAPPEKLHPTLSCWIKNMKKLSSLTDRLQELASSAPTEHQSQLLRQVNALRVTSKKQQEQFVDFLRLSEEYAKEHLLDIDAYIQQQSSFLAKLERHLEAAKKLRGEAAELQMLYESGTVATMRNLRTTGKATSRRIQRLILRSYFQHFRGRFERTKPFSERWTPCCMRLSNAM